MSQSPDGSNDIEQLLALTLAMVKAAESGDWERVQTLERRRRRIIDGPDTRHQISASGAPVAVLAKRLREADERLLACAVAHRNEIASATSRERARFTAQQSYRQTMEMFSEPDE